MQPPDPAVDAASPLDALYGLEVLEAAEDRVSARFDVGDAVRQPIGLVHGGVYASAAESLGTLATGRAVAAAGAIAVGMSTQTSFLRPVTDGAIRAEAVRRHRGRTTWIWDVDFTDDDGRLCAVSRATIAVRPGSPPPASTPG